MADDNEGLSTGNPAGFIRGLIQEGEGPTAGLSIYREAGGAIQDSRWFELYGQVANTVGDRPEMLGLDPFLPPNPGEYETWALGRGDQFMTQVDVLVFDKDIGSWLTMPATYVTDEPHSAEEAESWAWDNFDPNNTGSDINQTMYGAIATTFASTVPYGAT